MLWVQRLVLGEGATDAPPVGVIGEAVEMLTSGHIVLSGFDVVANSEVALSEIEMERRVESQTAPRYRLLGRTLLSDLVGSRQRDKVPTKLFLRVDLNVRQRMCQEAESERVVPGLDLQQ